MGRPSARIRFSANARGHKAITPAEAFFKKGNNYAAKDKMSPESHERRMKGLRKAWDTKVRKENGEKIVSAGDKKRIRVRLRQTIAKEAREIQDIARTHADQAMYRLAEIVNDPKVAESVAIQAAQVIFDRAYGKASQTNINANVDANGKETEISGQQLDQRIAAALKRVEDIAGRKAEAEQGKERPVDIREPDPDTSGTTKH